MKRMLKGLTTAQNHETAAGLLQIVFVLAVVGGMLVITAALNNTADNGPKLSNTSEQLVVDVLIPTITHHTASQKLPGVVEVRANVTISPEVNGRVVSLHPRLLPGGVIDAGATLFSLDQTDYRIALERAAAEVASAVADLKQAQANADNFIKDWQRVYPNETPPELVAKEPQIDAGKARLAAAKAAEQQAKINLERTNIKAQSTIRIVESNIEEGQFVVAGAQYGTYYVPDSLRIRTSIEPQLINKLGIRKDKETRVSYVNSEALTFTAPILSVGAALDQATRLQPIMIDIPSGTARAPGTFVSVRIEGEPVGGVFVLPTTVLSNRTRVWRVTNNQLEAVSIDVIDLTDNTVIVRAFDVKDGIVVSQVPTSFVNRPVKIRNNTTNTATTESTPQPGEGT